MRKSNADQHPHPNHQPNSRYGRVQQIEDKGEQLSSIHDNTFLVQVCVTRPRVWWPGSWSSPPSSWWSSRSPSPSASSSKWSRCSHHNSLLSMPGIILGIREDCHLPTREDPDRGSAGPGRVLHHSLRGHLWGHRHEGPELLCSAARGWKKCKEINIFAPLFRSSPRTAWLCLWMPSCIIGWRMPSRWPHLTHRLMSQGSCSGGDQCGWLRRLRPGPGRHHLEECAGNPHPRRHPLWPSQDSSGDARGSWWAERNRLIHISYA